MAFIVSAFFAWYGEHRQVNDLSGQVSGAQQEINRVEQELADTKHSLIFEQEQNAPKFEGEIELIGTGNTPELDGVQIWIQLAVRNTGAPSVVERTYWLRIKSSDLDISQLNPRLFQKGTNFVMTQAR